LRFEQCWVSGDCSLMHSADDSHRRAVFLNPAAMSPAAQNAQVHGRSLSIGRARSCRPDGRTALRGFMRDLAKWIHTRWEYHHRTSRQPFENEGLEAMIEIPLAKRAHPGGPTVRNGAEPTIHDDEAQLRYSELDLPWPGCAEDGTLRIDPETHRVLEIRRTPEQTGSSPLPDEKARNGHDVVSVITSENGPLRQATLQLEALTCVNRRKDEFLAIVAHELRNPLASIHYAVRLLGTQTAEAPARVRMQALIERQLRRMTQLVDELLDVSRITSGHLHLHRERLDLRDAVSHAIETLEWDLLERNHPLATELPEAPVWLRADAGRLEQVFVNLLANASRYTNAGGRLSLQVRTKDGEAIIRVRDSGIGIAPEALPHIFDLFKQGNAADPRSRPGLGVGLAVVRNLVELHGGTVTAASAGVGHGSEFTVRLPIED
jgi:signal transduction histidine kinase